MKDALGNELQVGDKVHRVYNLWQGKSEIREETVTGFTPKRIRVKYNDLCIPEHIAFVSRPE